MNWKSFVFGASIGFIGGFAAKEVLSQKRNISPEKALENVKEQFKNIGSISGSWIKIKPELIEKEGISYAVFKGGISKYVNETNKQYEFIVDATTGTIIDVYPLN